MRTSLNRGRKLHWKSPVIWISLIILLFVIRAVAPGLILKKMNAVLAEFSEVYVGHIQDLDINLLRSAYQLEGLELKLRKTDEVFVSAGLIDVSIAWRELFKGRVLTDIDLHKLDVKLTNSVLNAFSNNKKASAEDSKEAAGQLFPMRVERVDLKDSSFEFAEIISVPDPAKWRVTEINGRASNITPTPGSPLTLATLRGKLFGTGKIQAVAQFNQLLEPLPYDVDLQLNDFELKNANDWLKKKLPLTITSGKLDLYTEVRSENGRLDGYAKPFVHKADIIASGEDFKGFKHVAIEVSAAAANLVFRSAKEKTLATKVLFSYSNGEFQINSWKAISEAFKNGFSQKLPEGLDDEITLSKKSSQEVTKKDVKDGDKK